MNALVVFTQPFYEGVAEKDGEPFKYKYGDEESPSYRDTPFRVRPFLYYFTPIFERYCLMADSEMVNFLNEISPTEDKLVKLRRFEFTFLFNFNGPNMFLIERLKLKRCLFEDLMRKVLIIKLNKIGFHTREFYSEDLTVIHLVIKAQHSMLLHWAEVPC